MPSFTPNLVKPPRLPLHVPAFSKNTRSISMVKQSALKRDMVGAKTRRKDKVEGDEVDEAKLNPSLSKLLKDRQAKKTTHKLDSYTTKRRALYDIARTDAKNMTNEAISYLEEVQESILDLKSQETTFKKYFEDLKLAHANEETAYGYSKAYESRKCAKAVEKAQELAIEQRSQQKDTLEDFSKEARRRLNVVREEQQKFADASAFIKHYKNLLRA